MDNFLGLCMDGVKDNLTVEALKILYYSIVYPYLQYSIHVWGSAMKSFIQSRFTRQNRIKRIISGVDHKEHISLLFVQNGILKNQDVFK